MGDTRNPDVIDCEHFESARLWDTARCCDECHDADSCVMATVPLDDVGHCVRVCCNAAVALRESGALSVLSGRLREAQGSPSLRSQ